MVKPADILLELRDIHTPPVPAGHEALEVSLLPFAALAAIVAAMMAFGWWRRSRWRRQALRELRTIARQSDIEEQWTAMVDLLQRLPTRQPKAALPPALFRPLSQIDREDVAALKDYLSDRIRQ